MGNKQFIRKIHTLPISDNYKNLPLEQCSSGEREYTGEAGREEVGLAAGTGDSTQSGWGQTNDREKLPKGNKTIHTSLTE